MDANYHVSPKQILSELEPDYFAPYLQNIDEALQALYDDKEFEHQIELCGSCLRVFWANYARKHIAKILESFPRVQRALFGLEEYSEGGSRYRDHYIHMFDVFVTGARILSQVMKLLPDCRRDVLLKKLFRTTPEPTDLPFPRAYSAKERTFFLWTLIASFHDIGIPVEHLENIRLGLNRFLGYFGLHLNELKLTQKTRVSTQLHHYFDLMSRLYENGIRPNEQLVYDRPTSGNSYLYHALAEAYGGNDHGVISGVCLLTSYEETFLVGHHDEPVYDLSIEQYSDFVSRVLEHDVARAALSISMHHLSIETYPKLFPIDPRRLPMTYLLVLCDEIQEPFRHEGITYLGVSRLKNFPEIEVHFDEDPLNICVDISNHYMQLKPTEIESILDAAAKWGRLRGESVPEKYPEFLGWTWENICKTLRTKLLFDGVPFSLAIQIYLEEHSNKRRLIFQDRLG